MTVSVFVLSNSSAQIHICGTAGVLRPSNTPLTFCDRFLLPVAAEILQNNCLNPNHPCRSCNSRRFTTNSRPKRLNTFWVPEYWRHCQYSVLTKTDTGFVSPLLKRGSGILQGHSLWKSLAHCIAPGIQFKLALELLVLFFCFSLWCPLNFSFSSRRSSSNASLLFQEIAN